MLKVFLNIINKFLSKNTDKQNHFKINQNEYVIILTREHTLFVAHLIQSALLKSNINSKIITETRHTYQKDTPYIIICPQIFKHLPSKRVIFFQMEQYTSRWFTKKYFKLLNKADFIFDYSLDNISVLLKEGIPSTKIFYLPLSFADFNITQNQHRKNDILFYGDASSPRRKKFLDEISSKYNIKIVTNLYGDGIKQELLNSKIVLNIHFYKDSVLETTRIYEALSYGCIVISESSPDINQYPILKELVNFVDCGDVDAMISSISFLLDNNTINQKQKYNLEKIKSSQNIFDFFFFRFLLYIGYIGFSKFYEKCSPSLSLSNKIFISLPESLANHNPPPVNNLTEFDVFPIIRHHTERIGTLLTYKFICKYMEEKKYSHVVIYKYDAATLTKKRHSAESR